MVVVALAAPGVPIAVSIAVTISVPVTIAVSISIAVPVTIAVSISVTIAVSISVPVAITVSIAVPVSISVPVAVTVTISISVTIAVSIAVAVAVSISVPVAVTVTISISVTIAVSIAVAVAVAVSISVSISIAVPVPVAIAVPVAISTGARFREMEEWLSAQELGSAKHWKKQCHPGTTEQQQQRPQQVRALLHVGFLGLRFLTHLLASKGSGEDEYSERLEALKPLRVCYMGPISRPRYTFHLWKVRHPNPDKDIYTELPNHERSCSQLGVANQECGGIVRVAPAYIIDVNSD